MKDARGVDRGACKKCNCSEYAPPDAEEMAGMSCVSCGHAPGSHLNQDRAPASVAAHCSTQTLSSTCRVPGCNELVDFDLNTGLELGCYCFQHISSSFAPMECQDIEDENMVYQGGICDGVHQIPLPSSVAPMQTQGDFLVPQNSFQPAGPGPVNLIPVVQPAPQLGQPTTVQPPGQQTCALPECPNPCHVEDSGRVHDCCSRTHAAEYERRLAQQQQQQPQQAGPGANNVPQVVLPSGQRKCAIPECPNPCYVDGSGTVHECCGISHAMEHQRRKAIQQQNQVVKGVTHCLLPECNKLVWPFKNYCGRSHADIGTQRGLRPPVPQADPNAPKDKSLCIIPGCNQKKFSEGGVEHPFCGRSHAELGKQMNIQPSAEKPENQCDLPGCQKPKRREGTRVHDYCCRDHATQDAPNRDARILTSDTKVKEFLKKFKNLKVTKMEDNDHAKPGGALFRRFKQKWDSLPKGQQRTCLAFHGTADSNISSICQNGYDPNKRSGQAYGAGEYFATSPDIPISYCKGGKRMLLNELLLGQNGTHHTMHGNIVVMKDPAHDLPRFVITFQ